MKKSNKFLSFIYKAIGWGFLIAALIMLVWIVVISFIKFLVFTVFVVAGAIMLYYGGDLVIELTKEQCDGNTDS